MNKIIILFLASSLLLSACGFHFRGAIKVPEVMQDIHVTGDSFSNKLGKVLQRRIQQLGIIDVPLKENASSILTITRNNFIRRVLTVDSASKASAYKLDMIIAFEVTGNDGKILIKNQQVRQTREYNIDPANALASGDQENRLKLEMVEFIVNQILTRMSIVLKSK